MAAPSGSEGTVDNITEILATTFVESSNGRNKLNKDLIGPKDHVSTLTLATSFMSSYSNIDGPGPHIPDRSKMILDGVRL